MAHDDSFVTQTSRQSLRILGTVGEPINPEAWRWYFTVVGNSRCQIVDTWWQVSLFVFRFLIIIISLICNRLKQVVL
jgi:acyl-coenzyme A synthetase/AMP-(fatty) acid ligase